MSEAPTIIPLINKFRPVTFDEVFGHPQIISTLKRLIQSPNHPHCYCLIGPSGTGKTTIARLLGKAFNCEITEIAAADHSGTDDMRDVIDLAQHMSMIGSGNRMFLIDECHSLSRAAWQVLLKVTEEPPTHVYFALCTTEPEKVPETIRNQRAYPIMLRKLSVTDLSDYTKTIADLEGWNVHPDVFAAIVTAADGSPRAALTLLQTMYDVTDPKEVRRIITLQDASNPLIALVQMIMRGDTNWQKVRSALERIDDDEYTKSAVQITRYIIGAITRENDAAKAAKLFDLLAALTFPTDSYDAKTKFFAGVGRIIFQKGV